LIGATTVLLVFSMAVTVLTQAFTTALGRGGKQLRSGIADLLQQLGISQRDLAENIADSVLKHPMISNGTGWFGVKLGTVIHREELTKILMDAASDDTQGVWKDLKPDALAALNKMLQANGITDPAETLKNVRTMALQMEASHPELATDVRQNMALLKEASSDYVARMNSWFDQTIDRVSQRFTRHAHYVTVAAAAIVVLVVQLDMIAVVNRLSLDDKFRNQIVSSVISEVNAQDQQKKSGSTEVKQQTQSSTAGENKTQAAEKSANGQTTEGSSSSASPTNPQTGLNEKGPPAKNHKKPAPAKEAKKAESRDTAQAGAKETPPADKSKETAPQAAASNQTGEAGTQAAKGEPTTPTDQNALPKLDQAQYYNILDNAGLITMPQHWWASLSWGKVPGMVIAALLISLGAPFWYNILKNLIGLRSGLAQKDDMQRLARQTTQQVATVTDGAVVVGPAMPPSLQGERGDLEALG
jgi:hypothetical protein